MENNPSFKKITSSIALENFSILTDTGFEKVNKLHKTVPYEIYELKLFDGKVLRCADNHIVFYKDDFEEVFVKNLSIGDKILVHSDETLCESEVESISPTGIFEEMYDFELHKNSKHRYYTNDILSHNTAIAEGLALRIYQKKVDRSLKDKKIIELNITAIVSGTKYRGDFEQRMDEIVKEVQKNPDIIIFIDEIHNVIGAGSASGSMDAANIIKPALARGEMRCIGATTLDEYKKVIENDSALERRFQKVYINVPTREETLEILKQVKIKYEDFHGVSYSEEILKSCIDISDRYVTDRNFPDKALDLMDEVGSGVKLHKIKIPESIQKLEIEMCDIVEIKDHAAKTQDYEKAAIYRDKQRSILALIEQENIKWKEQLRQSRIPVEIEDVAKVVSKHTGIPLNKLTDSENIKLIKLDKFLKDKIIGQDEAVEKIVDAIHRSRIGIQDPDKPISSFLFLGSTGVGKCFCSDSQVVIRNKTTGLIENITINEFKKKL
jgi:ATP-dependent Clp protease ATP-binding subunit ClpC